MIHRELDQFFTTQETAQQCLGFLRSYLDISNLSWIEPSAGAGSFLRASKLCGYPLATVAYDLMPQYDGVIQSDFLKVDLSDVFESSSQKLCLGNPPFGKNSSLAVKFFNHAAPYCDFIAMIFPATFSKASLHKRLDKSFHLVGELDLGSIPFDFVNEKRLVPVVFQVWKKENNLRVNKSEKLTSEYFSFVKKEDADFAIQRVGAAAGKVKVDLSTLAPASHYFIKVESNTDVRSIFENIDWSHIKNKTAGNPSIAKTELIREFENQFSN